MHLNRTGMMWQCNNLSAFCVSQSIDVNLPRRVMEEFGARLARE
jgi:hypothetical protein